MANTRQSNLHSTAITYMARWHLTGDGTPIDTATSCLLPVTCKGLPAMLKVTSDPDELRGNHLMTLWHGHGAAAVMEHDHSALLLERAVNGRTLADIVYAGADDDATRHLSNTAKNLHALSRSHWKGLRPLESWFSALLTPSCDRPEWLKNCALQAQNLLSTPQEQIALHGDLHHGNILDFGARGWLAIDPKGLLGERTADFAASFLNPDLADPKRLYATVPHRFENRVRLVSYYTGLAPVRLLHWIQAWSGLSAVWFMEAGLAPNTQRTVAHLAGEALR